MGNGVMAKGPKLPRPSSTLPDVWALAPKQCVCHATARTRSRAMVRGPTAPRHGDLGGKHVYRATGITRAQWWCAETLFMHSTSRPSGAEWLTSPRLRMPTIRLLLFMTGSRRTLSSSMC
jgi:hypothetical protein